MIFVSLHGYTLAPRRLKCVCHLVDMWVPVFIMSGLSMGAVDAGEEGGLGEVQFTGVQTKCFRNHLLNAATHIPDLE